MTNDDKDSNVLCKDIISRHAAIDALIKADYEFTGILSEPRARRFEQTINALPSAQPEDCDTCKHGYFGDSQCDNCRVGYPSHYERRTDG